MMGVPSRSKYKNQKVELDGYKFDSRAEARRYVTLREMLRTGEILDLEVHPSYRLEVNGVLIGKYTADFRYNDPETYKETVEDVKSSPTLTTDYRLRKKLMRALYNIDIIEIGV